MTFLKHLSYVILFECLTYSELADLYNSELSIKDDYEKNELAENVRLPLAEAGIFCSAP